MGQVRNGTGYAWARLVLYAGLDSEGETKAGPGVRSSEALERSGRGGTRRGYTSYSLAGEVNQTVSGVRERSNKSKLWICEMPLLLWCECLTKGRYDARSRC